MDVKSFRRLLAFEHFKTAAFYSKSDSFMLDNWMLKFLMEHTANLGPGSRPVPQPPSRRQLQDQNEPESSRSLYSVVFYSPVQSDESEGNVRLSATLFRI
jgi:hypothetical protein